MGDDDDEDLEVVSVSGTSDESEYDIISAVEKALTGDSKSS